MKGIALLLFTIVFLILASVSISAIVILFSIARGEYTTDKRQLTNTKLNSKFI